MADRVDGPMHAMKSARGHAHPHGARAQTQRSQLRQRHDAMLRPGKLGDRALARGWGDFRQYC
jgi:hypothetical protein